MKTAFIVEFPTQFEVPFYQYVAGKLKAESLKLKAESLKLKADVDAVDASRHASKLPTDRRPQTADGGLPSLDFHVIYNNTDQQDYHDFELGKKVGWGFNLYQGYTHFIADKNNIVNSVSAILEKENYDYIILNGYKDSYAGLTKLCKQKNIPIALRIDSVLYNLSPLKKLLKRIYLPFAYRKFDHFFAVGSQTKSFLNWLGIKNERISYFSYSVDEAWFSTKANDTLKVNALKNQLAISNQKVLLSVAKFVPRESPWDILKAFETLNDVNLALVLVGDGADRKALEDYASRMPHLKIIFTGYIPYQELGYYYGISDIFIHAAKNEPWGVSVHEALACGCTVITSNKVGSSTDLIIEGKNGFTYPFGDSDKLAKAIESSIELDKDIKTNTNTTLLKSWSYSKMLNEIQSVSDTKK